jgi:hypothetical protein
MLTRKRERQCYPTPGGLPSGIACWPGSPLLLLSRTVTVHQSPMNR